jgi:mono/diheme cytochrome c family protein
MRISIRVSTAVVGAVLTLNGMLVAQSPRTVWDGVYTRQQAARGEQVYSSTCASCHGADLAGKEMAPALVGGEFQANWNGLTLDHLFDRIRTTMPLDRPQSLESSQVADVLAYVLLKSAFPDGGAELPASSRALGEISYVAQR